MSRLVYNRVHAARAQLGSQQQVDAAVAGLLEALPACGRLGPDTKVLLKPNLLSKSAPERAITTHPAVVLAVIRALQGRGVRHITVADSPGGPYNPVVMRGVYAGCGLAAVCAETGAEAYTACETVQRPAAGGGYFTLLRPVAEADFIINLPKMKTHVLATVSGAVKNLYGCVPGLAKAEFHMRYPDRADFARLLVEVCETVAADVHLVDGLLAMEGDGPGNGSPRECGLLLAGEDPYLVDLALCRVMGIEPMGTPVLAAAHARGLCPPALPEGTLAGDAAAAGPVPGYKPPASTDGQMDFGRRLPKLLQPLMPPLTRRLAPRPVIRRKACIGCGKCSEICPGKVITMAGRRGAAGKPTAAIDHGGCIKCFCCHEVCPVHAVDVWRAKLLRL